MAADPIVFAPPSNLDYSLVGINATKAVEMGLAEADWYQCSVPRETMRALLQRRDGPAIRDTCIWLGVIRSAGRLLSSSCRVDGWPARESGGAGFARQRPHRWCGIPTW